MDEAISGNWVPKVHPLSRGVEPEDPMELIANPTEGDPEEMLQCLVHEFALMGYSQAELRALFESPAYPVLGQLRNLFGAAELERRLGETFIRLGGIRFSEVMVEEEKPEHEEHEFLTLSTHRLAAARRGT